MKIISYSLFKGPDPLAELFYVRGFYFNVLMNSIVYPGWKTVVHVDDHISGKYHIMLKWLTKEYGVQVHGVLDDATHCMKMLWRMKPIFWADTDVVICRDADALTSLTEAKVVDQFIESGKSIHGILDNPAHSIPLMGGMCGFKCQPMRDKYESFEKMTALGSGIDKHGSDQKFLNDVVYNDFSEDYICSLGRVSHDTMIKFTGVAKLMYQDRTDPRWLSDLCTSFIGAAGCNEMETLRYLRSAGVLKVDSNMASIYPKIFYFA
jgi:hypothetical protein